MVKTVYETCVAAGVVCDINDNMQWDLAKISKAQPVHFKKTDENDRRIARELAYMQKQALLSIPWPTKQFMHVKGLLAPPGDLEVDPAGDGLSVAGAVTPPMTRVLRMAAMTGPERDSEAKLWVDGVLKRLQFSDMSQLKPSLLTQDEVAAAEAISRNQDVVLPVPESVPDHDRPLIRSLPGPVDGAGGCPLP